MAVLPPPTRERIRPAGVDPVATNIEDSLARRLGWDLATFREQTAANKWGTAGGFALIAPRAFLKPRSNLVDLLRVASWKRFGNSVHQLSNVFFVAELYGATRVEFPGPHPFFAGNRAGPIDLVWASADTPDVNNSRAGLYGDFFYLKGLGLRPETDEAARVRTQYVRPLLIPRLRQPHPEVGDNDVVMHFRGGDVFTPAADTTPAVASYGQPPLAYYLAAARRQQPEKVWIVHEDRSNPGVEAAEAALQRDGVRVRMQSSDLESDLRVMLSARTLVMGRGSFGEAVATLSERLRVLYAFEAIGMISQNPGTRIWRGYDRSGAYRASVRSGNWAGTPAQIDLMLHHPIEDIVFTDRPVPPLKSSEGV